MFRKHRQETITYLVLWGLLLMAPVLSLYIRTSNDSFLTFEWSEIFMVWRQYGIFFAIFLVHNHLLAPLLVYKQRRTLYFTIVALIVALFTFYQCTTRPADMGHRGPRPEMMDNHRPPEMGDHRPPEMDNHRPSEMGDHRPPEFDNERPPHKPKGERPPVMLGQREIVVVVLLILMLFANLGIKLYFKQRRDQLQMAKLEKQNLEQRLEYLKYQLNPHFLMNTLNNIHALVDIDPERSKEAIIQLSKILRYVLYESNHELVPVAKEVEFMENYVQLMRMRYGDKLLFSVSDTDADHSFSVPPLLFISFVENAFKHGVSYQEPSFIAIERKRYKGKKGDDRLLWTCRNSKHQRQAADKQNVGKTVGTALPQQGGVGLKNVRQRLDLIYGSNYSLNIEETDATYEVILDIPLET